MQSSKSLRTVLTVISRWESPLDEPFDWNPHLRPDYVDSQIRFSACWARVFDFFSLVFSSPAPPTLMRKKTSFFSTYKAPPTRLAIQNASSPSPWTFAGGAADSSSSPPPAFGLSFFACSRAFSLPPPFASSRPKVSSQNCLG